MPLHVRPIHTTIRPFPHIEGDLTTDANWSSDILHDLGLMYGRPELRKQAENVTIVRVTEDVKVLAFEYNERPQVFLLERAQ